MATKKESDAPGWVLTAWDLRTRDLTATPESPGGPLNAARIVSVAISLADDEGLHTFSIRKLADRLGSGVMTTYRHIESRDALVQLMVDTALGTPPADPIEDTGWRERTSRWHRAIIGRYLRHPWLTDAPVDGAFATPHRAEWLESLLASLSGTGLELDDLLQAALLIDGHARSTAALARTLRGSAAQEVPAWLGAVFDPSEFPFVARTMQVGALSDDTEPDGDFGLQRILDGIEQFADGATP